MQQITPKQLIKYYQLAKQETIKNRGDWQYFIVCLSIMLTNAVEFRWWQHQQIMSELDRQLEEASNAIKQFDLERIYNKYGKR